MALKDAFKISRKTFFNPSGWLGYNELSAHTKFMKETIKETLSKPEPEYEETFEQAMERQNLKDADVDQIATQYLTYSIALVAIAAVTFAAGFIFVLEYKSFPGLLLCFAVTGILGAQAFRFNFWYFQIKQRKLGCTFQEWRRGTLGDGENK